MTASRHYITQGDVLELLRFAASKDAVLKSGVSSNPLSKPALRRRQPEAQLHAAVVEHLRLRAKPDVLWIHPANGERRDKITGAKLKRLGVLAGASDLLLWHRGNSFALELKAPGGRPTEAQLDFLARFNEAGGHSACVEGVDRALAALDGWGLLRGRVS